ncbi:MAG: coproporphyrinogen III oxidase family protein [Gammaproteobacteria bacterium]|nr:coproporphyrinogen III oxidase family protein [Gammaproteobacteria bacterium]MCH9743528.1 coproporphyrinogen III oxidase family protein [Gammaproteobacteria bacterium]
MQQTTLKGQERAPYPNKCYLPFILYPPGMHANTEGSEFLQNHIDMQEDGDNFVMYISIPFCRVRCKGCPYFVSLLKERDPENREDLYIEALVKDLINWSKFKKWSSSKLRSIYIGGGTGSILRTENLKRIVDTLFKHYDIPEGYELTLEGNARDLTDDKIDYIANSEITRVSLGVQSFQPEILNVIGSPHAAQDSITVIKKLQKAGMKNIQMDLMYNMPGHTLEIWQSDLQMLSDLDIPHFTIYLYRIHTDTPQDRLIKKGIVKKPEDPETPMVKAMYNEAKRVAEDMGYTMYMKDHFCKPGYENMYNHWNFRVDVDTLGVGPGSYSFFGEYRLGTENNIKKYIEQVNKGDFLISTLSIKLNERMRRERYIVFALLYYEIDFKYYQQKFGTQFLDDFREEALRLEKKKLVILTDEKMILTQEGYIWHTNIILEFFNPAFWGDTKALDVPHWSLNGIGVEVGARKRQYWLGEKDKTFFNKQDLIWSEEKQAVNAD